ncbi:DUF6660 family protein [Echinicola shivajiensis]|uniref:DUF6660 family protein n=1 Tax=Echinicola shivajiensis TaxID=1035916 RepID=UPI001BFC36F6|nr:DUF6660 family protein [Echinicola shivajiensis]
MEIILRYYLFALMLFPCGDEQVQIDTDSTDTIFLAQDEGHQNHSDHDDCSPLCVCHCCHLHYVIHDQAEINFIKPYSIFNKVYVSDIPEDQVKDFLKPPKPIIS